MRWWPPLGRRIDEPELMDSGAFDAAGMAPILADLALVNRLTLAARPTLGFLARLTRGWPRGAELRVADLGYGDGAMLRTIHRWATRRGLVPRLTGVDLNPACRALAERATPAEMAIIFHEGDIFAWQPDVQPHAIVSALFAHHLDDAGIVRLLRWQDATARDGWLVNDLHRHRIAHLGFGLMAGALGLHPVVRHDGALSVRRSFRRADWAALLADAGIGDAEVRWHPLFRLCVARLRSDLPGAVRP